MAARHRKYYAGFAPSSRRGNRLDAQTEPVRYWKKCLQPPKSEEKMTILKASTKIAGRVVARIFKK